MQSIGELLKERQNIILKGFDPVSAGGFTQVPNVLLRSPRLSSHAKCAYGLLLSYAWYNDLCFPGQETMAQHSGNSIATINRAIKELEHAGWLKIVRRGQGKTNVYFLYATVGKSARRRS